MFEFVRDGTTLSTGSLATVQAFVVSYVEPTPPPNPPPASTTWTLLGTVGVTGISDLARDPATGELCVAARLAGVWCSSDNAHTWKPYPVGADAVVLQFTPYGLLVAACQSAGSCRTSGAGNGIYRRANGTFHLTGLTTKPAGLVARPDGSVLVIALDSGGQVATFRSTDGETWRKVNTAAIFSGIAQRFAQSPAGELWIGTESSGTYRSVDGGVTFAQVRTDTGALFSNIQAIGFQGSDVFVGGKAEIRRWTPTAPVLTKSGTTALPFYLDTARSMTSLGGVLYVGTNHTRTGTYAFNGSWSVFHEDGAILPAGPDVAAIVSDGQRLIGAMEDGRIVTAVP